VYLIQGAITTVLNTLSFFLIHEKDETLVIEMNDVESNKSLDIATIEGEGEVIVPSINDGNSLPESLIVKRYVNSLGVE
jgi:hypothetical protein